MRRAFVVANVDSARRFKAYLASSEPNAVLSYTARGFQIPSSAEEVAVDPSSGDVLVVDTDNNRVERFG